MAALSCSSLRIRFTNCPTEMECPPRAKKDAETGTFSRESALGAAARLLGRIPAVASETFLLKTAAKTPLNSASSLQGADTHQDMCNLCKPPAVLARTPLTAPDG